MSGKLAIVEIRQRRWEFIHRCLVPKISESGNEDQLSGSRIKGRKLETMGQEDPDPLIDIKVWKVLHQIQTSKTLYFSEISLEPTRPLFDSHGTELGTTGLLFLSLKIPVS